MYFFIILIQDNKMFKKEKRKVFALGRVYFFVFFLIDLSVCYFFFFEFDNGQ